MIIQAAGAGFGLGSAPLTHGMLGFVPPQITIVGRPIELGDLHGCGLDALHSVLRVFEHRFLSRLGLPWDRMPNESLLDVFGKLGWRAGLALATLYWPTPQRVGNHRIDDARVCIRITCVLDDREHAYGTIVIAGNLLGWGLLSYDLWRSALHDALSATATEVFKAKLAAAGLSACCPYLAEGIQGNTSKDDDQVGPLFEFVVPPQASVVFDPEVVARAAIESMSEAERGHLATAPPITIAR